MSEPTLLVPANGRYYSLAEKARIDALLGATFYLLRNDGISAGERLRCKHCRGRHAYYSVRCIEAPFSAGQVRSAYAGARITRYDPGASPLGRLGVPDLAAQHPRTARGLGTSLVHDLGPAEKGEHWVAFLLGTAVPITPRRAQELADRIRAAGDRSFALQPLAAVAAAQPILQEVDSHA